MSLRDDAIRLADILGQIHHGLLTFDQDERADYTRTKGAELAPFIKAFRDALNTRSRESAQDVLENMAPLLDEINGAATKGEIKFVAGKVLEQYWELRTIFREARYRGQPL